jgi:hypothetical protein
MSDISTEDDNDGSGVERSRTPLADLLLHPVRWRILQRVMGREVTTTDLKRDLPEVPPATLYRHVAALIEAGYLVVVRERRVRGTTERTLAVNDAAARIDDTEARAMTVEQHRQAFLMLLTRLAEQFDQVVARGELYTRISQFNYSQLAVYVDDDDAAAISEGLLALLQPYLQEAPGKSRVTLSMISLPEK